MRTWRPPAERYSSTSSTASRPQNSHTDPAWMREISSGSIAMRVISPSSPECGPVPVTRVPSTSTVKPTAARTAYSPTVGQPTTRRAVPSPSYRRTTSTVEAATITGEIRK